MRSPGAAHTLLTLVARRPSNPPLGVAVAGLGEIGRLHARNLAAHVPGARLALLVDQVPAAAQRLAGELGVAWSTSYADALADPAVDAVVIATPTPLHARMVGEAAAGGVHVFCEKPLALDVTDARTAADLMHAAGRCLQVGFQRRFDPDWLAAKRCLDAGEVGRVELFRVSHRNRGHPHGGATDSLGSLFVDMTVHDMDSARWLVGEVSSVDAFATRRAGGADVETAVVVLRFENGALGVIDNTRVAGYGFECSAELMGAESTLRIGTHHCSPDIQRLTAAGLSTELPGDHIQRHRAAYRAELRHFAECARSGRPSGVGGEAALAALELALAAERSLRGER